MASFGEAAEKNEYRKDCVAPVADTRVQTEVSYNVLDVVNSISNFIFEYL
jgi:hypothetical protein